MLSANFKPKRTAAASRGFLAIDKTNRNFMQHFRFGATWCTWDCVPASRGGQICGKNLRFSRLTYTGHLFSPATVFASRNIIRSKVKVRPRSRVKNCYLNNSGIGWRILTYSYTSIPYHGYVNWLSCESHGLKVKVAKGQTFKRVIAAHWGIHIDAWPSKCHLVSIKVLTWWHSLGPIHGTLLYALQGVKHSLLCRALYQLSSPFEGNCLSVCLSVRHTPALCENHTS